MHALAYISAYMMQISRTNVHRQCSDGIGYTPIPGPGPAWTHGIEVDINMCDDDATAGLGLG
jgi:hypothetical protein